MNQNLEKRKRQIEIIVDEYYKNTSHLYNISFEVLLKRALDLYLNTDIYIGEVMKRIAAGELLNMEDRQEEVADDHLYEEVTSTVEEDPITEVVASENVISEIVMPEENNIIPTTEKPKETTLEENNFENSIPDVQTSGLYNPNSRVEALLLNIIPLFNQEGIDYQITGDWATYLKYAVGENIDTSVLKIHVNERDMDKLNKVLATLGLNVSDNRQNSKKKLIDGAIKGEAEIYASSSDDEMLIEIAGFERLVDGTIIDKTYYCDDNGQACCREDVIGHSLAGKVYDKENIDYQGQRIPIVTPEYNHAFRKTYDKSYNKKDDDVAYLNKEVLVEITNLMKTDLYVQFVPVNTLPPTSMLNSGAIENDNSEISQMLADTQIDDKTKEKETEANKEQSDLIKKTYMKARKQDSQSGKIDGFTIIALILLVVALVLIGLIIFTWVQK